MDVSDWFVKTVNTALFDLLGWDNEHGIGCR